MQKKIFSVFLAVFTILLGFNFNTAEAYYSDSGCFYYNVLNDGYTHAEWDDFAMWKTCIWAELYEDAAPLYNEKTAQINQLYDTFESYDSGIFGINTSTEAVICMSSESPLAYAILSGQIGNATSMSSTYFPWVSEFSGPVYTPEEVSGYITNNTITNTQTQAITDTTTASTDTSTLTEQEADRQVVTGEASPDVITGNGYTITLKSGGFNVKFDSKCSFKIQIDGVNYSYYKLYSVTGLSQNVSGLVSGKQYSVKIGVNNNYTGTQWEAPVILTMK